MRTKKKKVLNYLNNALQFRERKNKYVGIVNLLALDHPFLFTVIKHYGDSSKGKELTVRLFIEFMTMNRWWNKLLKDNPELRGKDYEDKELLEEQTKIDLGYEVGYHADVKKLKQYDNQED